MVLIKSAVAWSGVKPHTWGRGGGEQARTPGWSAFLLGGHFKVRLKLSQLSGRFLSQLSHWSQSLKEKRKKRIKANSKVLGKLKWTRRPSLLWKGFAIRQFPVLPCSCWGPHEFRTEAFPRVVIMGNRNSKYWWLKTRPATLCQAYLVGRGWLSGSPSRAFPLQQSVLEGESSNRTLSPLLTAISNATDHHTTCANQDCLHPWFWKEALYVTRKDTIALKMGFPVKSSKKKFIITPYLQNRINKVHGRVEKKKEKEKSRRIPFLHLLSLSVKFSISCCIVWVCSLSRENEEAHYLCAFHNVFKNVSNALQILGNDLCACWGQ